MTISDLIGCRAAARSGAAAAHGCKAGIINIRRASALLITVIFLFGFLWGACPPSAAAETNVPDAGGASPASQETAEPDGSAAETGNAAVMAEGVNAGAAEPLDRIRVRNVDELLSAIGSDRLIELSEGDYCLTEARSYGRDSYSSLWYWQDSYDGYQLVITGVRNLCLTGAGAGRCSIVTDPRYANVLRFEDCIGLDISGLTLGHTPGEGFCSGGVLDFFRCEDVSVSECELYGCGTYGITASECAALSATGCSIHDCTYGALQAISCLDVRFTGGEIRHCGYSKEFEKDDWTAFDLLEARSCTGFAVLNTEISDSRVQTLFHSSSSVGVLLSGCSVRGNTVGEPAYSWGGMFQVGGRPVTVTGTEFADNVLLVPFFYSGDDASDIPVTDAEGNALDQEQLQAMNRELCDVSLYESPVSRPSAASLQGEVNEAGLMVYRVSTTDEFLAAIGDDTVIQLETATLDLSTATDCGGFGGLKYRWEDCYDGPGLTITGVRNLRIVGLGRDETVLLATPRYASVLTFRDCDEIQIRDLTAGHTLDTPGSCGGDVLSFDVCRDVSIEGCGLFGCGVDGIYASGCSDFSVRNTEMYDCSEYGAILWGSDHFAFEGCSVRNCGQNGLMLSDVHHITWDGESLGDGYIPR